MKHLLTAIACCLAVGGSAQFPYNPDSDGDNMIGMDDFLDFLPLFGAEFYPDSLQTQWCDGYSCNCDTCFIEEGKKLVFTNMTNHKLPEGTGYWALRIVHNEYYENQSFKIFYTDYYPLVHYGNEPFLNYCSSQGHTFYKYMVRNGQGLWMCD